MTRAYSWTNADGLVVGFGPNTPHLQDGTTVENVSGEKVHVVHFDWKDINAGKVPSVPVAGGSKIASVRFQIHETWVGGGASALIAGDGGAANGWITIVAGDEANLVAGASIPSDGAYLAHALVAADDTVDASSADTDWTSGRATMEVVYF